MKNELVNHFTWLANKIVETKIYKNWNDAFKVKEVEEAYDTFYNSIKNYIDLEKITVEQAKELRFGKWDDKSDLYLFPLWVVPLIPEGMEVTSIFGGTFKYNKETVDNDIRFGCVSYGINIKEGEKVEIRTNRNGKENI